MHRNLLLKFENYVLLLSLMDSSIDVVNGIKQNDISLTFQKSDVMSAGKQSDIILKFDKYDAVNRNAPASLEAPFTADRSTLYKKTLLLLKE